MTLDNIDRIIIRTLQEDGSLSVADVAKRLGMTTPPCWRRMKRLRDEGFLVKQVWVASAESLGLNLTMYATVKLATHDNEATMAFKEQVGLFPEVQECYILLGNVDVLLRIVVSDIKYYEDFFYRRLSQLPGVREVNSSVVMTEIKRTTSLPV